MPLAEIPEAIEMPIDEKRMKMEKELDQASSAIYLIREALYDFEYLWLPDESADSYAAIMQQKRIKFNYAKEAAALLPGAIKTIEKYLKE